MPSSGVNALQIAVMACEVIQLGSEAMQLCKQKEQYLKDGGFWNLLDVSSSACVISAVVAHFSGDLETLRTFGSIGVACKWLVCEYTVSLHILE